MQPVPLKLPAAAVAQLQAQAERLQTTRTGLARALLLQGLAELQQLAAAQGVEK